MKHHIKRVTALMTTVLLFTLCLLGGVNASEMPVDANLSNASFGVMTGSTGEQYLMQHYPAARIDTYPSIVDALTSLTNGKVDYVMAPYTTSANATHRNPDLEIYAKDIINEACSIAVSQQNPTLLAELNQVIANFKTDGTLDQIIANWTTIGEEYLVEDIPVAEGKNGTLRVAVSADREPMCFMMNNTYKGLDCELIERIAYVLDKKVEYQNMQFSALVSALSSGKADVIISNFSATEERRENVSFTESYFENPQVLLRRIDENTPPKPFTETSEDDTNWVPQYTEIAQLAGKTVSSINGSAFDQMLVNRIPDIKFKYFNTFSDQLAALAGNKTDAAIADVPVAQLGVSRNPDLVFLPEILAEDSYGFIFPKGSPLTPKFNAAIKELREEGLLDLLIEKWTGAEEEAKVFEPLTTTGKNGTLRVVSANTTEPMSYVGKNGKLLGYDLDILRLIGQKLGYEMEFTALDFASLIPAIQSGKADVAAGLVTITEERQKLVDMTEPYYNGGVVAVVRKVSPTENTVIATTKPDFWSELQKSFERTFITEERWKLIVSGLGITVLISICSGILGTILGFSVCMLKRSHHRALCLPASIFIRIIQGTPIVVLLMLLYYVVFGSIDLSAIIVAILGFSINFAAYVSEMMRTGISAVEKGQIEAANALGFTKIRTFWKIVFPQAARHFLPVFRGEFISMVKMTSIVGYIAIQDLTKVSDIIRSRTLEAFFPLIVTAILYFLVANILTMLLTHIELRLDPQHRAPKLKGVLKK